LQKIPSYGKVLWWVLVWAFPINKCFAKSRLGGLLRHLEYKFTNYILIA